MRSNLTWDVPLLACLFSATAIFGQVDAALVGGIARDGSSGGPLAEARIVVHSLDSALAQSTVSRADGIFTLTHLPPGVYDIVASKPGYRESSTRIELGARQMARVELTLESATGAPSTEPLTQRERLMLERIDRLEGRLAAMEKKEVAEAPPIAAPVIPQPEQHEPAASTPAVPPVDMNTPFADWDWSWMNGNSRQHESPLDSKYFTGEFRADTFFGIDFNQPKDHSMGGSSEVFRNGEVQLEDLSIGGDFHAGNMRGRFLALFGMFSATTVRNDASPAVGQWDVRSAYKYISEAYGGYHFNVNKGLNVDAGIFVSYVGLFSYYNFDNWAYQPSYVSSNTPWFFNGVRVQWFPTHHLKIEPWFINGWQSYNKFNGHPGLGGQIKWTPKPWLEVIGNQYGVGNDNLGLPHRGRYHTDDSVEVKYFDKHVAGNGIDKMAFTLTGDAGCETGDGVTCHGGKGAYNPVTGAGGPKQSFLGFMAYNRTWWHHDLYAFTLGGGAINNPGRYLTLVLPINGADAISGTPYFPAAPGLPFKAYDGTATLDYMPSQFVTFRMELGYRHANVPYWSGRGGITPPGGNNGSPANYVCSNGTTSGVSDLASAELVCGGGKSSVWFPDLRRGQGLLSFAIMVKL